MLNRPVTLLLRTLACLALCSAGARAQPIAWITVGESAFQQIRTVAPDIVPIASTQPGAAGAAERIYVLAVDGERIEALAWGLHQRLRQCGGFMYHASEAAARAALAPPPARRPHAYTIGNRRIVESILARMTEKNIEATIVSLSAFTNRYYTSQSGAGASDWLAAKWQAIAAGRSDIVVRQVRHAGYGQQSVMLTMTGAEMPDQQVVVGGHLDSIVMFRRDENAVAPGADDDASGIASMTEALRAMVELDFRPARTIHLIAYAAEEVGLRGSQDIAGKFRDGEVDVIGVLQLDMTNYKGAASDIYLFSDYTDSDQNTFLEGLVSNYLPGVTVGHDRCGYACSDHASWHALGYPASMPFEASRARANPLIHTSGDTFANLKNQAAHALKFAKLAAAYMVELGKPGSTAETKKAR